VLKLRVCAGSTLCYLLGRFSWSAYVFEPDRRAVRDAHKSLP